MQHVKLLRSDIDVDRIKNEIETHIFTLEQFEDQLCLQGHSEDMDPFFGARRLEELVGNGGSLHGHVESEYKHLLFPEMKYTNSIIKEMNLFRTRVMRLPKKRCLSWHSDPAPRVHIPIDTREGCLFVLEDRNYHLENNGSAYLVDTTKPHTAINATFHARTHIVGVTYEKYE